jgi:hypothetical protein
MQAIAQLETTREQLDPVAAMRRWRIEAAKNHVRRVSTSRPAAVTPAPAPKPSK